MKASHEPSRLWWWPACEYDASAPRVLSNPECGACAAGVRALRTVVDADVLRRRGAANWVRRGAHGDRHRGRLAERGRQRSKHCEGAAHRCHAGGLATQLPQGGGEGVRCAEKRARGAERPQPSGRSATQAARSSEKQAEPSLQSHRKAEWGAGCVRRRGTLRLTRPTRALRPGACAHRRRRGVRAAHCRAHFEVGGPRRALWSGGRRRWSRFDRVAGGRVAPPERSARQRQTAAATTPCAFFVPPQNTPAQEQGATFTRAAPGTWRTRSQPRSTTAARAGKAKAGGQAPGDPGG